MTYAERVDGALLMDGIIGKTITEDDLIDGVPVLYAPKTMKACGLVGGGNIALANALTGEAMPVLIYDDCYNKLNDDGKDYLIYHELSHVKNGDCIRPVKTNFWYILSCKLWVPKIEVLADYGCSQRIGFKRTISGMINLVKTCKYGYVQIARRMVALSVCNAIGTMVK